MLSGFRLVSLGLGALPGFCPNVLGKYKTRPARASPAHVLAHVPAHVLAHVPACVMAQVPAHVLALYFPRTFGQNRVRTPDQVETVLKRLKMKKLSFREKCEA